MKGMLLIYMSVSNEKCLYSRLSISEHDNKTTRRHNANILKRLLWGWLILKKQYITRLPLYVHK